MKCNEVKHDLAFISRNELDYERKNDVINHIQICQDCRLEYERYLKTFYLIDRAKAEPLKDKRVVNMYENAQTEISTLAKGRKKPKSRWLMAAISFTIIGSLFIISIPDKQIASAEKYSLKKSIENEKWHEIYNLLKTGKINDLKNERIPVSLILNKLELNSSASYSNQFLQFNPEKIRETKILLKRYQRFQKLILVKDILKYYQNKEISS